MNRFDKDFHGSDPASGRPFCSGYPDGIWMIAIILSFIFLGISVILCIGAINAWKGSNEIGSKIVSILPYVFTASIIIPIWISYIVSVVRRSTLVISLSAFIGAIALLVSIYSYTRHGLSPVAGLIISTIFMAFAWYCEGLREDGIIGNVQAEQDDGHQQI